MDNTELLKETIREILSEGFDIRKLEQMDEAGEIFHYMHEQRVPIIGEGSSRFVYKISPRFVLKLAIFDRVGKGRGQNQAEVESYTDPETRHFLNRIYKFDDDYDWVIAELVKPIKTFAEFKGLMGIDFETFQSVVYGIRRYREIMGIKDEEDKEYIRTKLMERYAKHGLGLEFIDEMMVLIGKLGQGTGDLAKLDHWGKTTDGRIVLYDYGFTKEVRLKHYAHP